MNPTDQQPTRVPPVSPFVIQAYRKRSGDPRISIEAERHAVALYDALACAEADAKTASAELIAFKRNNLELIASNNAAVERAEKAEAGIKREYAIANKETERREKAENRSKEQEIAIAGYIRQADAERDAREKAERELAEAQKALEAVYEALPMDEFIEDHDPIAVSTFKRLKKIVSAAREAGNGGA